jgi:hypothetical protein
MVGDGTLGGCGVATRLDELEALILLCERALPHANRRAMAATASALAGASTRVSGLDEQQEPEAEKLGRAARREYPADTEAGLSSTLPVDLQFASVRT